MKNRYLLLTAAFFIMAVLFAGCSSTINPGTASTTPAIHVPAIEGTVVPVENTLHVSPAKITNTPQLVAFVASAAAFARENGKDKAMSAFNDPNGTYTSGTMHIFAIDYDGNVLADALEPGIVGTNIRNLTDPFGIPIEKNLAETARAGRGYVSYSYPNPGRNQTPEPRIAVVEDVDGTYYVAAGMFASEGAIYPSVVLNTSGTQPGVNDLVSYVKSAVTYARANGKEKALQVFSDPQGQFVQGELVMMAFDYNGTNLAAPPYSPELTKYRINLLNYHDPDGVDTIRGMRDIARDGGGFLYTVANVRVNGKEVYMPKIDYAEPIDGDWWVFSGIIVPGYSRNGTGNLSGIQVRNHSQADLYNLVNQAFTFAKANGKEKTLAEINNPAGRFVHGDHFVWAESSNGTLLADPFWKSGIGENQIDYADRFGMKTTRVGIEAMENGTGFSHALFPNTAVNGTADIPKLIYMKAVDDTWWIGSGVYGVEVK